MYPPRNGRRSHELELQLHELSMRRKYLEKQHEQRLDSLRKLAAIRENSTSRMCQAFAHQNEQARIRNKKLLEEIMYTRNAVGSRVVKEAAHEKENDVLSEYVHSKNHHSAEAKLKAAKADYVKRKETMLPAWHRMHTAQLQEKVREIQREKALSDRRKELLRIEMMKEGRAKYDLEKHRQELLVSLAEEQQMIMEMEANSFLLQQEGNIVDAVVMNQVSESSKQVHQVVNSNMQAMVQDSLRLQAMSLPQQRISRLQQQALQHQESVPAGSIGSAQIGVRPPYEYSSARYGEKYREALSGMPLSRIDHRPPPVPQLVPDQARPIQFQRMPGVNVSFEEPLSVRSDVSVDRNFAAEESEAARTILSASSRDSSEHSPLQFKKKSSFLVAGGSIDVQHQAGFDRHEEVVGSPEGKRDNQAVDDSMHYSLSPASSYSLHSSWRPSNRPSSAPQSSTIQEIDSESKSNSLVADLPVQKTSTSLLRDAGDMVDQIFDERRAVGDEKSDDDSFDFESAVSAPPVHTQAPIDTSVASAQSPLRLSVDADSGGFTSGVAGEVPQPLRVGEERSRKAVAAMSIRDCADFVKLLTSAIEKTVSDAVDEASNASAAVAAQRTSNIVKEHYSSNFSIEAHDMHYDGSSEKCIATLIEHYHSERSLQSLNLQSLRMRLLGDAVLAVVQVHSQVLIPGDAFTGVVTIEKLKKEYKKNGPAGILQLWECLASHLQKLVEANISNLNYLSTCFTNALVAHTSGDERDRLMRKVSKLLQLAMIPSEKKSKSAQSPSLGGLFSKGSLEDSMGSVGSGGFALSVASSVPNSPHPFNTSQANSTNVSGSTPAVSVNTMSKATPATLSQSGYKYGIATATASGGSETNRKSTSMSAFYNIGGNMTDLVAEFEDAEIMDDESIEKPPPLKDLDAIHSTTSLASPSSGNGKGGRSPNDDEFDF